MNLIQIGLDTIMPIKQTKLHINDPPWITASFKNLIKLRQKAFASGDTKRYRHYRNVVNRERKVIRGRYFASKVRQLKKTKPSQWWGAVKRIAGMVPAMGSESLFSQLHIEGYDSLPPQDIANRINNAFLEPMEPFQCLETPPPFEEDPIVFNISETAVFMPPASESPKTFFDEIHC